MSAALPDSRDCPLQLDDTPDLEFVRDALRDAGYTVETILRITGSERCTDTFDAAVARWRARGREPAMVLGRLLALGCPVASEEVCGAISSGVVASLRGMGLLQREDGNLQATARLMPFQDGYVFGDFGPELTGRLCPSDFVMGVGGASLTLAALTIRREVDCALDLGTGGGVQALLAAGHCRHVVGTDISRRALTFARATAALNGIDRIEWREGSFFEPVEADSFDLIVSNPPFVISPSQGYEFRDGGLPGDQVCERVVHDAAQHLNDGGCACLLLNWWHTSEDDWRERPWQWVANTGCDALILCLDSDEPLKYAIEWLRSSEQHSPAHFEELLAEWMAYYDQLGIERISAGAVVLRKPAGRSTWIAAERIDGGKHVGPCGKQIERILAGRTFVQAHPDDDSLLRCCPRLCAEHAVEHTLHASDGQWGMLSSLIKQTRGLTFSGRIDMQMMSFLARCNGRTPLSEAIEALVSEGSGAPPPVRQTLLRLTRRLIEIGMLVP